MEPSRIEMFLGFSTLDLHMLKQEMERLAGDWNGDEPAGEDRATCAKEIAEKCEELQERLDDMAEYI